LVMLSILTSLAAGSWLERVADRLTSYRDKPIADSPEATQAPDELTAT
jgi:hypothetical protein